VGECEKKKTKLCCHGTVSQQMTETENIGELIDEKGRAPLKKNASSETIVNNHLALSRSLRRNVDKQASLAMS